MSRDGCKELWGTVLIFGIEDALGRSDFSFRTSDARKRANLARDREWIGSHDFMDVCELAGVNASMVEAAYHSGKFDERGWNMPAKKMKAA